MSGGKHRRPIEVTRKRLEDKLADCRAAAERARAAGAAGIAREFEDQAKRAEAELRALDGGSR